MGVVETDEKGRRPPSPLSFQGVGKDYLAFLGGSWLGDLSGCPKALSSHTRNGVQRQGPRRSDFAYRRQ